MPDHVRQVARKLEDLGRRVLGRPPKRSEPRDEALRRAVLAGFGDRVGRVRKGEVVMVGGGSARLSKESVVQGAELIVAVDIGSGGQPGRGTATYVRTATQIEEAWLEVDERASARWDAEKLRAEGVAIRAYRDLVLGERPGRTVDPGALSAVLAVEAKRDLDRAVPMTDALLSFVHRYRFLRREVPELEAPDLGDDPRIGVVDELCSGKKSFVELAEVDVEAVLASKLPRDVQAALRKEAPEAIAVPSGRTARLRYDAEGPPVLSIRLQEVFGLYATPRVAKGRVPFKMELLAPNMRPVQVTQDLASFWATTYGEVRRELSHKYPKHQWPEDPRDGVPSARVRRRAK
jgi:ATP-dependent helicase HrpB